MSHSQASPLRSYGCHICFSGVIIYRPATTSGREVQSDSSRFHSFYCTWQLEISGGISVSVHLYFLNEMTNHLLPQQENTPRLYPRLAMTKCSMVWQEARQFVCEHIADVPGEHQHGVADIIRDQVWAPNIQVYYMWLPKIPKPICFLSDSCVSHPLIHSLY